MNNHKCDPSLYECVVHPRIHVWKGRVEGGWHVTPRPRGESAYDTHAEAVNVATERARAERLAAVQSAEGQAAS